MSSAPERYHTVVADLDFTLYAGDVRDVLPALPAESIDCCVTSPPYWGLRDYGAAGQLGLESSPEEYVAAMVATFKEVRRLLKSTGTLWLNLGDSYAANRPYQVHNTKGAGGHTYSAGAVVPDGLKPKDLVGIPWRVALALQADGWYLRSDIVWSKPNPMPESVTDRPTKSHEYVFLLSKGPRYFYDAQAIADPATWYGPNGMPQKGPHAGQMRERHGKNEKPRSVPAQDRRIAGFNERWDASEADGSAPLTRNARSVWEIGTQPYADAHFAVFPEELPRRCILAGCPEGGTVLDPFMGSGTTALVARKHGRKSIGVEINPDYAAMAARRLGQQSLLALPL